MRWVRGAHDNLRSLATGSGFLSGFGPDLKGTVSRDRFKYVPGNCTFTGLSFLIPLYVEINSVSDPYSFFTDPDPVDPDGGQYGSGYGSGSGSNPDPGL